MLSLTLDWFFTRTADRKVEVIYFYCPLRRRAGVQQQGRCRDLFRRLDASFPALRVHKRAEEVVFEMSREGDAPE